MTRRAYVLDLVDRRVAPVDVLATTAQAEVVRYTDGRLAGTSDELPVGGTYSDRAEAADDLDYQLEGRSRREPPARHLVELELTTAAVRGLRDAIELLAAIPSDADGAPGRTVRDELLGAHAFLDGILPELAAEDAPRLGVGHVLTPGHDPATCPARSCVAGA